jgi:hypothetical protein
MFSQPIPRVKIWREKLSATFIAIIVPFLGLCLAYQNDPFVSFQAWESIAVWTIFVACSGPVCALIARSSIGGTLLNLIVRFSLDLAVNVAVTMRVLKPGQAVVVILLVSLALLGLGVRMITQFQFADGVVGTDLLTALPAIRVLRCRPSGSYLNFVRKELGLLRPLWLTTAAFIVGWAVLSLFSRYDTFRWPIPLLAMQVAISPVLAGVLSLSEEKASGIHQWHLTLPMTALKQWLLKAVIAVIAGILCAVVIPVVLSEAFPTSMPSSNSTAAFVVVIALVTYAGFWSACATKEAIRAVLLLSILLALLWWAYNEGIWVWQFFRMPLRHLASGMALKLIPIIAIASIQSYRNFVRQPAGNTGRLVMQLLTLVAVTFVAGVV